jgi:undecaprenyl diphosphate synthase
VEENAKFPEHIGIIMDGNRRWARQRKMPVNLGHMEGAKALKKLLRYVKNKNLPIKYITVYAFSTENWTRSEEEVNSLMKLFLQYLEELVKDDEGLCLKIFGDKTILSEKLQNKIREVEEKTKDNTRFTLGVCLNYSGRTDITQAVKEIAKKVKENEINVEDITPKVISEHLYTKDIPNPDIVVRTSGEYRISDFLSWQIAYSELYFLEKYWPDFNENDLEDVILEYSKRSRRFGK